MLHLSPWKCLFYVMSGQNFGVAARGKEATKDATGRLAAAAPSSSNFHDFMQLGCCHTPLEKTELALVSYLSRRVQQAGHCRPIQRGREADAPDSRRSKFPHGERFSFDPHHEIDRLGNRRADRAHCVEVRQTGSK